AGDPEKAKALCFPIMHMAKSNARLAFVLGASELSTGDVVGALDHLYHAIRLAPENPLHVIQIAGIMHNQGLSNEAVRLVEQICEIRGDATFRAMAASLRLPVIARSLDHMRRCRAEYEKAVEALEAVDLPVDQSQLLLIRTNFLSVYQGVDDRIFQEKIAAFYRRLCPALSYRAAHLDEAPGGGGKKTIAFISTNLRNHTVGKLYRGIIRELDRSRFRVIVFAPDAPGDEISNAIHAAADSWHILPKDLSAARSTIAAERPDLIYYTDIGMEPLTYFLAFARLAKVQCVSWGHPVTTGIDGIDYFISCADLEGEDATSRYLEKLIQLSRPPTCLYEFQTPGAGEAPTLDFAEGKTLYCCPQSLFKIHPDFDQILIELLRRDRAGVAVFIEGLPGWSGILMDRWRAIDIDCVSRIYFLPKLDQGPFLALLRAADVILDSVHFGGGISSAEAIAQGTPIVTWPSLPNLYARVTLGYYRVIGMEDCIAGSAEEYVELALRLGRDKEWRDEISARIRERSPLLFERKLVLDELTSFFERALEMSATAGYSGSS
ncbi:MAG: hypothetical protein HQ503_12355, partial [Rhodospirillales bacterium]|nr:hypothetical protein [Rhodospirillales bacterium]